MSALDVLVQDEIWINREGERIPLGQIDRRYAGQIVKFLERRALRLHRARIAWYIGITWPTAPHAYDAVEHEYEELLDMDPVEWLHQQPLVRALAPIPTETSEP